MTAIGRPAGDSSATWSGTAPPGERRQGRQAVEVLRARFQRRHVPRVVHRGAAAAGQRDAGGQGRVEAPARVPIEHAEQDRGQVQRRRARRGASGRAGAGRASPARRRPGRRRRGRARRRRPPLPGASSRMPGLDLPRGVLPGEVAQAALGHRRGQGGGEGGGIGVRGSAPLPAPAGRSGGGGGRGRRRRGRRSGAFLAEEAVGEAGFERGAGRAARPCGCGRRCRGRSRSATASSGDLASGSVAGRRAPMPPARRKAPSMTPRLAAMRSGKPAASRAPASPSGSGLPRRPRRRRCRAAARRMRCRAPRSASACVAAAQEVEAERDVARRVAAADRVALLQQRGEVGGERASRRRFPRRSMVRARRGCAPSRAMRRPVGVMRARAVQRVEVAQQGAGGGHARRRAAGRGRRALPARRPRRRGRGPGRTARLPGFPAGPAGARPRCSASDQSRIATPGAVRPARPARCSAAARAMRTVARRERPVAGSSRGVRRKPPSTTIARRARSARSRRWRWPAPPCGASLGPSARGPARPAAARRAAAAPRRRGRTGARRCGGSRPSRAGRRARRRHARASAARMAAAIASGRSRGSARSRGRCSTRTGKARPRLSITGQSPRRRGEGGAVERGGHGQQAQLRPQRALQVEAEREGEVGVEVALMRLVEQHGRDAFEARGRIAGGGPAGLRSPPRRACAAEMARSSRVARPIVPPGASSPSSSAMRRAAARAATRRGSSTRMRPSAAQGSSCSTSGHEGGLAGAGRGDEHGVRSRRAGSPGEAAAPPPRAGRGAWWGGP